MSYPKTTHGVLMVQYERRIEKQIELLRWAKTIFDHHMIESGECCCGTRVTYHDFGSGHAPVDTGPYMVQQWREALDELGPRNNPLRRFFGWSDVWRENGSATADFYFFWFRVRRHHFFHSTPLL